jgi:Flp pilus assembly protein TadB
MAVGKINTIIKTYTKADQGPGRTQLVPLFVLVFVLFSLFVVLLIFLLLLLLLVLLLLLLLFIVYYYCYRSNLLFYYYTTFLRLRRECHIQSLLKTNRKKH